MNIGHFQVTRTRDFSNFLKIIHKLTSFFTLCCIVWRQKRFKQSQEPQKRIFYMWKYLNPYISHFQVTKTLDFRDFLKSYINWRRFWRCVGSYDVKTIQAIPGTSKTYFLHMKTLKSIYWPFTGNKTRDFSNFLKIIHKLTSLLTSCSVVCRQKHFKQSQEPQKRIVYIGNIEIHIFDIFGNKYSRF